MAEISKQKHIEDIFVHGSEDMTQKEKIKRRERKLKREP